MSKPSSTLGLDLLEPDTITLEEWRRRRDAPPPSPPPPPRAPRVRPPTRPCAVDGCGRPHEARGLCSKHYQRWKIARRRAAGTDELDNQADELEPDPTTPPPPGHDGSCGLVPFLSPQDFGGR